MSPFTFDELLGKANHAAVDYQTQQRLLQSKIRALLPFFKALSVDEKEQVLKDNPQISQQLIRAHVRASSSELSNDDLRLYFKYGGKELAAVISSLEKLAKEGKDKLDELAEKGQDLFSRGARHVVDFLQKNFIKDDGKTRKR